MVIESYRKEQCDDEESYQNRLITGADNDQPDQAKNQDYEFGDHYVGQYCADKEPFLSFEERAAIGAVVFYLKRSGKDRRLAASGTSQPQRSR